VVLACVLAGSACDGPKQASSAKLPAPRSTKPVLMAGATPVAPFVAEAMASGPALKTVVYVGASWCEPCRRFHDALSSGQLDGEFAGVRFIEYDLDRAKTELSSDGYGSRLIPLFALPESDGRASPRKLEGSVKGESAVHGNLVPRLRELLRE
jgi:thiol-disulfide isomerase/thioredoxin